MLKKSLAIAFSALAAVACCADTVIKAEPVKAGEIKLDGVLNEAVWQKAAKNADFKKFTQKDVPANEKTAFQAAASPEGVYFAFDIEDRNIVDTLDKFDGDLTKFNDVIELFISADDPIPGDPNVRMARQIIFNFKGTRADGSFLAGSRDSSWTSDWQVAVSKSSKGVTAELFVPYYALDFTNAKTGNLRFNIGRENINADKTKTISVWQNTSNFMDMTKFAVLELPYKDFDKYQWLVTDMTLQNVPSEKGTLQMLKGKLSGKISGIVALQATARSNGTLAAFNRSTVQVKSGETMEFAIPLSVGKPGKYNVTLTARSNGSKLFYATNNLEMSASCFTLKIAYPIYRKSFFPDQKDKTLRVTAEYAVPEKLMSKVRSVMTITDAAGKVIKSIDGQSGTVKNFTVDTAAFPAGSYTVTVTNSGAEYANDSLSDTFRIIAPATPGSSSVRLDDNRYLLVNGKPFFPRGFIGGQHKEPHFFEGMQAAGYNTVQFYGLNWPSLQDIKIVLDKAHKCNLKVFCYPYWGTSIGFTGFRDLKKSNKHRKPRLTEAQWERLKKMVDMVKEHPAFLGWYLADEPRGAELCDELLKVYHYLQQADPHHPVITLDFTANGCISKKDLADIHILDMYPHPFKDGSWARSLPSVFYSMKQVNENTGSAGTWFCPEAFTPRGKNRRPMTYRELRCLIFGTIVNGATGMMPYKIGSIKQQYYIHGKNSGIFYTPEMRLGYLEGLGPELNALDAVLTAPEKAPVTADTNEIIAIRKKYNNKDFVIVVNTDKNTLKATIKVPGIKENTLQLVSENRTVAVNNAVFSDNFEPFAVHIYTNDKSFKSPVNIYDLEARIRQVDKEAKAKLNITD